MVRRVCCLRRALGREGGTEESNEGGRRQGNRGREGGREGGREDVPRSVNRLGFLRNSTNSITSRLASSTPATSLNVTFTW